ncbi:MAG: hypothetical protein WCX31_02740 [Salinivirgaceae bacterium]
MKKIPFITFLLLLIALLFSCRGSQQDKLLGDWERIPFTEPTEIKNYWRFYSGSAIEIFTLDNGVLYGDTLKYTYSIDGKTFSIFGDGGYDAAAGDIRGKYWVDELSDSYLKLTKTDHPVDPSGNNWGDTVKVYAYIRIELAKR